MNENEVLQGLRIPYSMSTLDKLALLGRGEEPANYSDNMLYGYVSASM